MTQVRPHVTHVGQPYVDEPVYARPRADKVALAVQRALGVPPPQPILIGAQRVRLNWRKPGK